MKKIVLAGTTLALSMIAGSALADNSLNSGTFGLNVGTQSNQIGGVTSVIGKYFMAKDLAVLAGLGFVNTNNGGGTDIAFMGGIRKYIRTEDFAPFVGGRIQYSSLNGSNTTTFGLSVEGGAEYFLAKHFSLEGTVAFGYASSSTTGFPSVRTIGTSTYALSANFYF